MNLHTQHFSGYGGIALAADVGGDPSHPAVILMHGGGQTRHSWGKAARELVRMGFYVISLDMRGHGSSGWAVDGDYSIDAFIGDLKSVMATLTGRVALVGASLGGIVSFLAHGENPELPISALVLVDVVVHMERAGVGRIADFMFAKPDGFADLSEVADAVASYMPHRRRPTSVEGLKKNLRTGPNGRLYWHWDPQYWQWDPKNSLSAADLHVQMEKQEQRMVAASPHITVPTLIVRGKLSDVVSDRGLEKMCQLVPHAEVVDVAQAGHMVAGDKNDRFNRAVERFLGALALKQEQLPP